MEAPNRVGCSKKKGKSMSFKYKREHLEWRPIKGLEGKYEISNYGDIHRLERKAPSGNGGYRLLTDYIFWSEEQSEYGGTNDQSRYLGINISKAKGKKYVHRLAAEAFCPNPNNKPEVNHKDGNNKNNYCGCKEYNYEDSNLEWVTHDENMKHASINNLINKDSELRKKQSAENRKKINYEAMKRPIVQLNKDNQYIKEYSSIKEASQQTGISYSLLSAVLGRRPYHKTAGGYHWIYKNEYEANNKSL